MDDERKGKVVYFAHPVTHYSTDLEWECIETIITMLTPIGEDPSDGFIHMMNPNQRWLQNLYVARKNSGHEDPFEIFREITRSCDIVVGCTFMNGTIGAGVGNELITAVENEIPTYLIYIKEGRKLFIPFNGVENCEILSIEETREKNKKGVM